MQPYQSIAFQSLLLLLYLFYAKYDVYINYNFFYLNIELHCVVYESEATYNRPNPGKSFRNCVWSIPSFCILVCILTFVLQDDFFHLNVNQYRCILHLIDVPFICRLKNKMTSYFVIVVVS